MLSNVEQRLTPQIEQASKATVPPITDENLATLLQADDIEQSWHDLGLIDRRHILKALLDVRVEKAPQLGGKFHTGRIKIAPRFAPTETYRWRQLSSLD